MNLAATVCLLALCASGGQVSDSRHVVRAVNHARAAHGLPALTYSLRLSRASRRWSRHLYRLGYLSHAKARRGAYRVRGEVLSKGNARPVDAWLNSPPHRAIVLSRWAEEIGAGRFGDVWTARLVAR